MPQIVDKGLNFVCVIAFAVVKIWKNVRFIINEYRLLSVVVDVKINDLGTSLTMLLLHL